MSTAVPKTGKRSRITDTAPLSIRSEAGEEEAARLRLMEMDQEDESRGAEQRQGTESEGAISVEPAVVPIVAEGTGPLTEEVQGVRVTQALTAVVGSGDLQAVEVIP